MPLPLGMDGGETRPRTGSGFHAALVISKALRQASSSRSMPSSEGSVSTPIANLAGSTGWPGKPGVGGQVVQSGVLPREIRGLYVCADALVVVVFLYFF